MSAELQPLGRTLILVGIVLIAVGAVLMLAPRLPWLGRLPGDLLIKRDHVTLYFPLATSVVISLILSVILWIFGRGH